MPNSISDSDVIKLLEKWMAVTPPALPSWKDYPVQERDDSAYHIECRSRNDAYRSTMQRIGEKLIVATEEHGLDSTPLCNLINVVGLNDDGFWKPAQELLQRLETKIRISQSQPRREPLSPTAGAIYELLLTLPEHEGMTGTSIITRLLEQENINIDQGRLTKDYLPELRPYGMKNKRRIGYFIPLSDRPKKSS